MRRYAEAPFNQEDAVRLPVASYGNPAVFQIKDTRKNRKLESKPYSILSASKYILFISLMLYWLPIIGQMISGFVGGRRAGSPAKAIIAALLPLLVLFSISQAISSGLIPVRIKDIGVLLFLAVKAALDKLPVASSYVNFATAYVGSFVNELNAAASFKAGDYLVTIAFAYIGGILSAQSRRELEYVSRYGAPTTNVLLAPQPLAPQTEPQPRSRPFASLAAFFRPPARPANTFSSLIPVSPTPVSRQARSTQIAETPRRVASWEDYYLSQPSHQWNGPAVNSPAQVRFTSHGPVAVSAQEQRTRKFVERALGKDYLEHLPGKDLPGKDYRTYLVGRTRMQRAGSTGEGEEGIRRPQNWELL